MEAAGGMAAGRAGPPHVRSAGWRGSSQQQRHHKRDAACPRAAGAPWRKGHFRRVGEQALRRPTNHQLAGYQPHKAN